MKSVLSVEDKCFRFSPARNEEINKEIETYVETQKGSQLYRLNHRAASKPLMDDKLGKKAEYFAASILTQDFGFPYVKPDLLSYSQNYKSFNADLEYNKLENEYPNVHVKSCNSWTFDYVGDYSWTFQLKNIDRTGGKDYLFNSTGEDLIALVYLANWKSPVGVVKAILPWTACSGLLREPVKQSLVNLKKCLYYKDLAQLAVK